MALVEIPVAVARIDPEYKDALLELVILFVGDWFEPLVRALLTRDLECQMRKPTVGRGPVPMLYACGDMYHRAGQDLDGGFALLLIPSAARNAYKNAALASSAALSSAHTSLARRNAAHALGQPA